MATARGVAAWSARQHSPVAVERDGRPRGRGERRSKSKEREGCCGPGQGPREAVVVSGRVLAGNGRSRCLWTPEMRAATDQRLR